MDQTWVFKTLILPIITAFICSSCIGSGDDSCTYVIEGFVKNASDSSSLANVTIKSSYYNFGGKEKGECRETYITNDTGYFTYEIIAVPQRLYKCPEASQIELGFYYEKTGFVQIDTVFVYGTIADGGTGERDQIVLNLPTIYLKPL